MLSLRALSYPALLLLLGAAVRAVVVALGAAADAAGVPYTDVDYVVFSEGAALVAGGGSPFDRATYRYTPLLALALAPAGALRWPHWGKALFSAADVAVAAGGLAVLRARGLPPGTAATFMALFLLHPVVINVTTRGSADAVVCALVAVALAALLRTRRGVGVDVAAVALGLAVHTKLYPVIYALPMTLFLDRHYAPHDFCREGGEAAADDDGGRRGASEGDSGSTAALATDATDGDGAMRYRRRAPAGAGIRKRRKRSPSVRAARPPQQQQQQQLLSSAPPFLSAAALAKECDRDSAVSLVLGTPLSAALRLSLRGVAAPLARLALMQQWLAAAGGGGGSGGWSSPTSWPWRALVRDGAGVGAPATAAGAALCLALLQRAFDFFTPRRCGFGALALLVFSAVTGACYSIYGWPFLWETYLYHLVRTDNRHNFSPYFYALYLRFDEPAARAAFGALALLLQLGTVAALGAAFYRDLPMAMFLQAFVFVTWNKVVTVQVSGGRSCGERGCDCTGLG